MLTGHLVMESLVILLSMHGMQNKDILLSIPLFILAGNIMSRGGMASDSLT